MLLSGFVCLNFCIQWSGKKQTNPKKPLKYLCYYATTDTWSSSWQNLASGDVFFLPSGGFVQVCKAHAINCTVTQDGNQTTYSVSDVAHVSGVKASHCDYSWANASVSWTSQNSWAQCFPTFLTWYIFYFFPRVSSQAFWQREALLHFVITTIFMVPFSLNVLLSKVNRSACTVAVPWHRHTWMECSHCWCFILCYDVLNDLQWKGGFTAKIWINITHMFICSHVGIVCDLRRDSQACLMNIRLYPLWNRRVSEGF